MMFRFPSAPSRQPPPRPRLQMSPPCPATPSPPPHSATPPGAGSSRPSLPGSLPPNREGHGLASAILSGKTGLACPASPTVISPSEGPARPGPSRVRASRASEAFPCGVAGPAHRPERRYPRRGNALNLCAPSPPASPPLPSRPFFKRRGPHQGPKSHKKTLAPRSPPPTSLPNTFTRLRSQRQANAPHVPTPRSANTPRALARAETLATLDPRFWRPHATNRPQPAAQIFLKTLICSAGRPHPAAPQTAIR